MAWAEIENGFDFKLSKKLSIEITQRFINESQLGLQIIKVGQKAKKRLINMIT